MPTPTGLPKAGDILLHTQTGNRFVVVKREGNDQMCSVILRPIEIKTPFRISPHPYGYPNDHFRLLEAGFWIGTMYEYET